MHLIPFFVLLGALIAPCLGFVPSRQPFIGKEKVATVRNTLALHASSTLGRTQSPLLSDVAKWHKDRRKRMLEKYRDQIAPLEKSANSQSLGLVLLIASNFCLASLAIYCGLQHNLLLTVALALFPGSIASLWQLQILHDNLHGSLLKKSVTSYTILGHKVSKTKLQEAILFWGSMPSAFGYFLYLKYGHMSHHEAVGSVEAANLRQLFESSKADFEDGDVLFVAHRMKLMGEIGPRFLLPFLKEEIVVSISDLGLQQWRSGKVVRNAVSFTTSFMFERCMIMFNDVVVAVVGCNLFFPNKPKSFHADCAAYCRSAVAVRAALWYFFGWQSLLFLFLAETFWSIPPHPACAMFVTNHGSSEARGIEDAEIDDSQCIPSSSTYAGAWYSVFTLGTNYHMEHHDFPTIPLHRLGELRRIAPEFYRKGENDNLLQNMSRAFDDPNYYACMDAGISYRQKPK
jgi:fatty acid desaturase